MCVCVKERERERESEKKKEWERRAKRKLLCAVQGKTVSACLFSWVWFCVAAADDPPWQKNRVMSTSRWTRLNSARGPQGPWKNIFSSEGNGELQPVSVCLLRFWPFSCCLSCYCLFAIDTPNFSQRPSASNEMQARITMQERNAAKSRNKSKVHLVLATRGD